MTYDPPLITTLFLSTLGFVVAAPADSSDASEQRVKFRPEHYGHVLVYPDNQIIDGEFCILGNAEPQAELRITKDGGVNNTPIYKFKLNDGKRIELSTAFCSESMASKFPADYIEKLVKIRDTYRLSNLIEYGDTVTYTWYIKFPEVVNPKSSGLISQWHGKPDKTLTLDPQGSLKYQNLDEMIGLLDTMDLTSEVNRGKGIDRATGKENGWKVDPYQRPVAALRFGQGTLNLVVRNDPNRLSSGSPLGKAGRGVPVTDTMNNGTSSTIVWEKKIVDLPVGRWIPLKAQFKWATYSQKEDKVTSEGFVKFCFDDEKEVTWNGPIGKNDIYAPYFQFGVYTGSGNVEVHHTNYQMTINKRNTLVPFNP